MTTIDLTVDKARRARAIQRARERSIIIPTYAQMKDPAKIPAKVKEELANILSQGIDDVIPKPYRPSQVFDCLQRHLGVHYRYKQSGPTPAQLHSLPESLARLPDAMRKDLANSLILGSSERIAEQLQQVEKEDAELARSLKSHIDRFDYLPILSALESASQQPGQQGIRP